MISYSAASSLGWLDFDAAASERASTLIRSLEEPGTLDALGIGSVRDVIAEILNPGTSTIQTRLRYFIFLPWIFNSLESQKIPPSVFAGRLRDVEARLIDCLRPLGPSQGTIGYSAGRDLKRMPSEIYWRGMGSWGLRRFDLSIAEYAQRAAAIGRLRPDRDDDGNTTLPSVAMWSEMPEAPPDFLDAELSFELRSDEAQVLVEHIRQHHPKSLMAAMSTHPELVAGVEFPWDLPKSELSPHLQEALRHARCFSELTVGPQHLYNVLLTRKAKDEFGWDTEKLETSESERLEAWAKLVSEREKELTAWVRDLPAFWAFLAYFGDVPAPTKHFVEAVVNCAVEDPAGFLSNETLHTVIRNREIELKGKRARLSHRSALEGWNQAPFGGQLDYRWPIALGYLTDIATAIDKGT